MFVKKATTAGTKVPAKTPAKTVKRAKPVKITFAAPDDMKPCFIELLFRTQEDGLIGPKFRCIRIKGNWDNDNAKRYDMMEYDASTVTALIARISAKTFATNALRRLPADSSFKLIIRAGKSSIDGNLRATVKSIAKLAPRASGKSVWKELTDPKDLIRRKLRATARFLPGALVSIQLPPSGRKPKSVE